MNASRLDKKKSHQTPIWLNFHGSIILSIPLVREPFLQGQFLNRNFSDHKITLLLPPVLSHPFFMCTKYYNARPYNNILDWRSWNVMRECWILWLLWNFDGCFWNSQNFDGFFGIPGIVTDFLEFPEFWQIFFWNSRNFTAGFALPLYPQDLRESREFPLLRARAKGP